MTRAALWMGTWLGMVAATLPACGDDDEQAATGAAAPGPGGDLSEAAPVAPEEDGYEEAIHRTRTHMDLGALAHLADVDHGGLFIDMGTPARMKYTMGRWRNAWGADVTEGDRTFTRLGDRGSLWFPVDRAEALTVQLRLRKVGARQLVVHWNDQTLRTLELTEGLSTHELPVPAEHVRAGENELSIRAVGTTTVGGAPVSIELDWIRVRPGEARGDEPPLTHGGLVREQRIGAEVRRAVVMPRGASVRWHLSVPPGARLALGVGSPAEGATAKVTLAPEQGDEAELFAGDVTTGWRNRALDLSPWTGKVVRLELSTAGSGEAPVAWSAPQVIVPLPERPRPEGRSKNVVVLTIDTLRASKLRPYNPETRVRTPALDAFALDATVFENAQSPENWTKPAVASILTSLFPMTHDTKRDAASLPDAALTLGEIYKEAGFRTGTFLANGYVSDRFGFRQGWDHYTNYIRENRRTEAEKVFTEAATWIEQNREERFFVYIQTIDPHVPYDPPDEYLRMYDPSPEQYGGIVRNRSTGLQLGDAKTGKLTFSDADAARLAALHDGEISYHDHHFGLFLERLKELGLYDDTVFVVTSDHGEEFREHGSWGHGHSVYQELLHVPLIVRWKPAEAAGLRVSETVSTMDIGPTILEATGVEVPAVFEGQSLLGYLHGAPPAGPAVGFSEFLDDRRVIRAGRWKLILRGNLTWTMFDLEEDPAELSQLDRSRANPIALRYTRTLLGQLLGASDRTAWLSAGGGGEARVLPQSDSQIDAELCRQLAELGYVDARCDAL